MCSVGSRLGAARSGTPVALPPHSLEGPVLGSCLWRVLTWRSQPGPLQPAQNSGSFGGGGVLARRQHLPQPGPEWASNSLVKPSVPLAELASQPQSKGTARSQTPHLGLPDGG